MQLRGAGSHSSMRQGGACAQRWPVHLAQLWCVQRLCRCVALALGLQRLHSGCGAGIVPASSLPARIIHRRDGNGDALR